VQIHPSATRSMRTLIPEDATLTLEALVRAGELADADRREVEAHLGDSADGATVVAVVDHLRLRRPRAKA
jgi:anti-sigma factor RsiW